MNLFEFFYLAIYLSFLTGVIAAIQICNPGKMTREFMIETTKEMETEVNQESYVDSDEEDTKQPFNPEEEDYTMTENPMLRQRVNILDHIN
jgi:hypothetical protein